MVQCYKIVLDYDLETLDSCSDQILTKLDNISIPSCSRDCRVQSNLNMIPTTFIYLSNASEGIMYQGSFNPLENYSFLGIDFLYYSNGPIRISINDIELANDFSKQYSQFEQPINGYDCSGQIFLTYQSIKIDYPNQQNNFQVKMWGDNSNQELRLRSIKVWTNCMDNCLNCDSSNSCSKCVEGFNLKVIKGKGMCETRNGCSTISSCYKCYPNQNGCSQCNPGYQLNKKGQCDDLNVLQVPCTTSNSFN